jgi:hypothetical protein
LWVEPSRISNFIGLLVARALLALCCAFAFAFLWTEIIAIAPILSPLLPSLKNRDLWPAMVNRETLGVFAVFASFFLFGFLLRVAPERRVVQDLDLSAGFVRESGIGEQEPMEALRVTRPQAPQSEPSPVLEKYEQILEGLAVPQSSEASVRLRRSPEPTLDEVPERKADPKPSVDEDPSPDRPRTASSKGARRKPRAKKKK